MDRDAWNNRADGWYLESWIFVVNRDIMREIKGVIIPDLKSWNKVNIDLFTIVTKDKFQVKFSEAAVLTQRSSYYITRRQKGIEVY